VVLTEALQHNGAGWLVQDSADLQEA